MTQPLLPPQLGWRFRLFLGALVVSFVDGATATLAFLFDLGLLLLPVVIATALLRQGASVRQKFFGSFFQKRTSF